MNINGKKISIIGAVRSGIAAAKLAKLNGAIPFVSDQSENIEIKNLCKILDDYNIEYELGIHSDKIIDADFIVTSPGVPTNSPVLINAKDKGLKIFSELEFASWFCKGKIIAITGTNGKTTTTSLCEHVFNTAGVKCYSAGNIGLPFSDIAMNVKHEEFVALEVSSFQLDFIDTFKPNISVLLNISPDHLDRYNNRYDLYIKSKMRITENQNSSDTFIYNGDDENIPIGLVSDAVRLFPFSLDKNLSNGCFVDDGFIVFCKDGNLDEVCSVNELSLKGEHNLMNSMAVVNIAINSGISADEVRKGLKSFKGVEHRLELVRELNGVKFINDSKATNVDSVWYAIRSFKEPIFLILGGKDKGNDYKQIKDEVKSRVKKIFAIGSSAEKIYHFFKPFKDVEIVDSLETAVKKSYQSAKNGDVILLSPACASFDMFKNYEDRGHKFKQIVKNL